MNYVTLDTIVRSTLMRRGYSLHWYVQFLKHSADCLRELGFDTLKNVNTKVIPVTAGNVVKLPCDFVDWTKVGTKAGQYVSSLTQNEAISRLHNYSGSSIANYGAGSFYNGYSYDWNYHNDGGTAFRTMGGTSAGFKLLRERSEIQLSEQITATEIVLEYIGDGTLCDNATKINPYAQAAIEAYVVWQLKEHNRNYGAGERQLAKQDFINEHKKLRSRLNPITCNDIINAFNPRRATATEAQAPVNNTIAVLPDIVSGIFNTSFDNSFN